MAIAGPPAAFPDMRDPANTQRLAQSVHSALTLSSNYPLSGIDIWVQDDISAGTGTSSPPAAAAAHRHLVALDSSAKLLVLGYTLEQLPELPSKQALEDKLADGETTVKLATQLAESNFIDPAYTGQSSVGLTVESDSQTYVKQLTEQSADGTPMLQLAPIAGEDRH